MRKFQSVPHDGIFLYTSVQEYTSRKWGSGSHTHPTFVSSEWYAVISTSEFMVLS